MLSSLVLAVSLVFSSVIPPIEERVDPFLLNLSQVFGKEYPVILKAAKRNDIEDWDYENLAILFAIRRRRTVRRDASLESFQILALSGRTTKLGR